MVIEQNIESYSAKKTGLEKLRDSLVDGAMYCAVFGFGAMAFKYNFGSVSYTYLDVFYNMAFSYPAFVCFDRVFFSRTTVLGAVSAFTKSNPSDTMPINAEPRQTDVPRQVWARVESEQGKHLRTVGIVPTDKEGGYSVSPDRVINAIDSFYESDYAFSQPKSGGLSSTAFSNLRDFWESQKLVEPDPMKGEGRYKFTRHGKAVIRGVAEGDVPL